VCSLWSRHVSAFVRGHLQVIIVWHTNIKKKVNAHREHTIKHITDCCERRFCLMNCLVALSVPQVAWRRLARNISEFMSCKDCRGELLWCNMKYYLGICFQVQSKTTTIVFWAIFESASFRIQVTCFSGWAISLYGSLNTNFSTTYINMKCLFSSMSTVVAIRV
jgi:hypothetical protein